MSDEVPVQQVQPSQEARQWAMFCHFAAFLGFVFWNRGVAEVGPAKAGLYYHLLPVFGIALSVLFLSEQPKAYHAIGVILIFAGIWLNGRKPR